MEAIVGSMGAMVGSMEDVAGSKIGPLMAAEKQLSVG